MIALMTITDTPAVSTAVGQGACGDEGDSSEMIYTPIAAAGILSDQAHQSPLLTESILKCQQFARECPSMA